MQKRKPNNATKGIKVHEPVHNSIQEGPVRKTVLPIQMGSSFTVFGGFQYYPFLDSEDNHFRTFLELRLLSPTQANCINDKVFYSVGDGLEIQDKEFPTNFDKKINGKRQTIDDILKAVFESIYQDGNKFIEIVCTEVDNEKFVHVYPHNNMDCRFEERKDGGDPTHVLRTKEFRKDGIFNYNKTDGPVRIPLWTDMAKDPESVWKKERNGNRRTMIHLKNDVQGIDHYGLPTNFSGLNQVISEYKAARFNIDNFENNMFMAGMLLIQGNLSTPEEKKLTGNIKKMYSGEGKGMRVLPISSEQGISDSKFIPFNQTHEGHFIEFDKHNEDKIIGANGWSRALLDMQQTGSLGKGGEFLKQLFKIKFRTVISPAQQIVLNNFIFPLMKIMDEYKATKFYDEKWIIKPVIPVSLEGLLDINSLLTVDEGRQELGMPDLKGEKGGKLISEVKAKQKPNDSGKPTKD